jgi:predicted HAD superfamily Cof-like phosphohydrolase
MKTNFNKVMEFNRAFDMVSSEISEYSCYEEDLNGNIKYNPLKNIRTEIFKDSTNSSNSSLIKLRLDLIREELDELNDAIIQNDIIEQRDACADILYVVYGMADILGIAMDDVFANNVKTNLEYYINNDLSTDFNTKTNLLDNNLLGNNSLININNISNFNKIKIISNNILGFNISSRPILELVQLIKDKLNLSYKELENNCIVININDGINDSINDSINDNININNNMITKFKLIANNLYDLLKWTYIMTQVIGVNADSDFTIVHDSNMSKLCSTKEDAIATVEDYQAKYKAGKSPYDSPYYYYLPDLNKWIVKNLSSGKALKNIKYKKVCFTNSRFVF